MENQKKTTKLKASSHGMKWEVNLSEDCGVHEMTDAFETLLLALTYGQHSIEEAFLRKAEQVRTNRLENKAGEIGRIEIEDDCN